MYVLFHEVMGEVQGTQFSTSTRARTQLERMNHSIKPLHLEEFDSFIAEVEEQWEGECYSCAKIGPCQMAFIPEMVT